MAGKPNISSERRKQLIDFQTKYLKGIHQFHDLSLLDQCLTHNSYRGEGGKYLANFKSLEWIGDRAMGLVITDHVFAANPDRDEKTRERMNKGRTELEVSIGHVPICLLNVAIILLDRTTICCRRSPGRP